MLVTPMQILVCFYCIFWGSLVSCSSKDKAEAEPEESLVFQFTYVSSFPIERKQVDSWRVHESHLASTLNPYLASNPSEKRLSSAIFDRLFRDVTLRHAQHTDRGKENRKEKGIMDKQL